MCAHASERNEALLERSAEALQALTDGDGGGVGSVPEATEALVELLATVTASREMRAAVGTSERELAARNERAMEALKRVDQEIIAAKVDAVQVFEERDLVARDLSRAQTALAEIEEFEKEESADLEAREKKEKKDKKDKKVKKDKKDRKDKKEEKAEKVDDGETLIERLKEVEGIEERIGEVLEGLDEVRAELVTTADEIEKIRKRRKQLQGKLSAAQVEW